MIKLSSRMLVPLICELCVSDSYLLGADIGCEHSQTVKMKEILWTVALCK
jgi:hypothetical protein